MSVTAPTASSSISQESIVETILRFVRKIHKQSVKSCRPHANMPEEAICLDTDFKKVLLFDGLSCVELEIMIEDEFGLSELDDDIWRGCNTVGDIVLLVTKLVLHS